MQHMSKVVRFFNDSLPSCLPRIPSHKCLSSKCIHTHRKICTECRDREDRKCALVFHFCKKKNDDDMMKTNKKFINVFLLSCFLLPLVVNMYLFYVSFFFFFYFFPLHEPVQFYFQLFDDFLYRHVTIEY